MMEESTGENNKNEDDEVDEENLILVKTDKPLAKIQSYGKTSALMVSFRWESAMKDIPNPVISKNFGQ